MFTARSFLLYIIMLFFSGCYALSDAKIHNEQLISIQPANQLINKQLDIQILLNLIPYDHPVSSIITDHERQELELDTIISKLDRTKTAFGPWGLKTITHPTADKPYIKRQQSLIKKLINDKTFRAEIINILNEIKQAQHHILSFWDIQEDLQQKSQRLYYAILGSKSKKIDDYLNRNQMALESAALFDVCKQITSLIASFGFAGLFNEAINTAIYKKDFNLKHAIASGLLMPIRLNSPFTNVYAQGYDPKKTAEFISAGTAGDQYVFLNKGQNVPRPLAGLITLLCSGYYDLSICIDIRDSIKRIYESHHITALLHHRMMAIAASVKAIESLHTIIRMNQDLFSDQIMEKSDIHGCKSPLFCKLINLLQHKTFLQKSTLLFSRGAVLLSHQLMHDIKQEFIPLLQTVGIIDAYLSIAHIYEECADKDARFCFPQFNDSQNGTLQLDNFWTPLMNQNHVVLNTFKCGDQRNKIILTGPNGCGKSTIMKAMAHSIILAQSCGIVPASEAYMPIFTGLRTSLVPHESLKDNLSTFMAEKSRIDAVRSFINTHKTDDRYFVILDEPYRGTVESEASYRVSLLGHELISMKHCMLVLATHLEKPIELETHTQVFANYHLGIEETQTGIFKRTFKLIAGPATWWFKDMATRARFVDQLLLAPN